MYNLGIWLLEAGIKLKCIFNPSLSNWIRKRNLDYVMKSLPQRNDQSYSVWVHCASLGEYHMVRPILTLLKDSFGSKIQIYLSFFSPSGYENVREIEHYDVKFYLPSDLQDHADKLIKEIQPNLFIGVKYEFWWNLLSELQKNNVPIVYVNVDFQVKPSFLNKIYPKFKKIFKSFDMVFVQNKQTKSILNKAGITNIQIAGDTRIDNVLKRKKNKKHFFDSNKPLFIWGSIYPHEMELINNVVKLSPELNHIIVPHEVTSNHIKKIAELIEFNFNILDSNNLHTNYLVDRVGLLFDLYAVASFAYVGGGMHGALHNILEPLINNVPTAFGPRHKMFPEAQEAIDFGFGFEVDSPKAVLDFITKQKTKNDVVKIPSYLEEKSGASILVFNHITALLTS